MLTVVKFTLFLSSAFLQCAYGSSPADLFSCVRDCLEQEINVVTQVSSTEQYDFGILLNVFHVFSHSWKIVLPPTIYL